MVSPSIGRFEFLEPESIDPWDCGYYGLPPKKVVIDDVQIQDMRSKVFTNVSPYKLTTTGFTAIKHKSTLESAEAFKDQTLLEQVYLPEVKELMKRETGARSVHIISSYLRLKKVGPVEDLGPNVKDPNEPCGIEFPEEMDLSKPIIGGISEGAKMGPVRYAHIDYSPRGAAAMLRHTRQDILEDARDIVAAEDQAALLKAEYSGPKYAYYSVWRPLKTVVRDPLCVCDPTSIDPEKDLMEAFNKQVGESGDFIASYYFLQGTRAQQQKWYYIKEQKTDEVLVIQLFDSHARKEGRPIGTPHGSPEMLGGIEEDGPRESIEIRVLVLW